MARSGWLRVVCSTADTYEFGICTTKAGELRIYDSYFNIYISKVADDTLGFYTELSSFANRNGCKTKYVSKFMRRMAALDSMLHIIRSQGIVELEPKGYIRP